MFESLVRNAEFMSRLAKAAACCFVGVGAVWRCYDRLNNLGGMYALVLCIFFAFSMIGIGVHIINEDDDATRPQGEQQ